MCARCHSAWPAPARAMTLASKQASIEAISKKLLEGYTLLAESCPKGCNVPLMRSPGSGESACVSCEGGAAAQPQAPRAAAPAAAPPPESGEDAAAADAATVEAPTLNAPSLTEAEANETAVREECARLRAAEAAEEEERRRAAEEEAEALRRQFSAQARAASDEASSRLAEKMLEGFTLLAQVSPFDGVTPLVRSRAGRRYCVASGLWLDPPAEGEVVAPSERKSTMRAPPAAGVRVIPLDEAPEELRSAVLGEGAVEAPVSSPQPRLEAKAAPAREPAVESETRETGTASDGLRRTEATLAAKLEEARAALADTPVTAVAEWTALCELVRTTVATLQALKQIR